MKTRVKSTSPRADVYQQVTDSIVKTIESVGSYERPWEKVLGTFSTFEPTNVTGKAYRGINVWLLGSERLNKGYQSNIWGTYKAWSEKGGQVRKGERGSPCVFWKRMEVEQEDGKKKAIFFARLYSVFNRDQVDGEVKLAVKDVPPVDQTAEEHAGAFALSSAYLANQGIRFGQGGDKAFYSISEDAIQMPPRKAFKSVYGWYSVTFHEIGHSTGAKSRLDRQFGKRFGDAAYALEEVVAELTAAYLCRSVGLPFEAKQEGDHAAYLKSWLGVLKEDPKAVFTLATAAQKAADFVIGCQDTDEDDNNEEIAA